MTIFASTQSINCSINNQHPASDTQAQQSISASIIIFHLLWHWHYVN